MLVQQLNSKGKPTGKYVKWTAEFWDKMVRDWGDKLLWIKVPEPVNVNTTLEVPNVQNKPLKKKKNEGK